MRIEGEVVGHEREIGAEQRLQPPALAPVDDQWLVAPEHAVVDEQQLSSRRRCALEQLERRGDAAGELRHLLGAEHLEAGEAVLGEALHLEQLVREGDDVVAASHRAILGRCLR